MRLGWNWLNLVRPRCVSQMHRPCYDGNWNRCDRLPVAIRPFLAVRRSGPGSRVSTATDHGSYHAR